MAGLWRITALITCAWGALALYVQLATDAAGPEPVAVLHLPLSSPMVMRCMRTVSGALLLCALLLLPSWSAWAIPAEVPLRALAYQSWGAASGLPRAAAVDLAFDADGFAWVATQKGLARFDGSQFQVFVEKDTPELRSSVITRLHADRSGRLWIGTLKNLAYRDRSGFHGISADGVETGHVAGLAEDRVGRLYVATDRGLSHVDGDRLKPVSGWQGPATFALAVADAVWVSGTGRVSRFIDGRQQDFAFPPELADTVVFSMAWSDGSLWIGSSRGLLRLRDARFDVVPLDAGAAARSVEAVAADGATGLWAGTDSVSYRLDRGRVIERLEAQQPGVAPWPLAIKAGPDDVWICSASEGLWHYRRSGSRRYADEDGATIPTVWSYALDGSRLLVGTSSGVLAFENNRFRPYIGRDALPEQVAYSLLRDPAGRLWVGTFAGLIRFGADGRRERLFPQLAASSVNGLAQEGSGTVWAATTLGLFGIDGDAVRHYGEANGLSAAGIRFVLPTGSGDLWIGADDGLFRRDGDRFEKVAPAGLDGALVTSLLELDQGRVLVGTYDRGLFLLDAQGWRQWNVEQGLPWASAYFMATTDRWLVVAGSDGAYRIDRKALDRGAAPNLPADVLVVSPGEHQGGKQIRCCNGGGNGKGVLVGDDVWLPTITGALRLEIDKPSPAVPVAHIIDIEHAHRRLMPAAERVLDAPSRDAAIHYGAIDYTATAPLQYRYRLNGFDEDWSDAITRVTAYYTNLPPGRFTFEVVARRPYGPWGVPVSMTLEVPRAYYETWWFRVLCGLLVCALIALFIRSRLKLLTLQKLALEVIVADRTRALEEVNRELQQMSVTDALTGLHNRRFLDQTMPMLLAKLARRRTESGRDLVIGAMLVDIDHFKRINDRYGHAVGDLVLQRAAHALRASVRDGEFVLRWGGEEFLAVIEMAERSHLEEIARRMHRAITDSCQDLKLPAAPEFNGITCSIGYAALPILPTSADLLWEDTIELADVALYAAKNAGRDRWMTVPDDQVASGLWRQQVHSSDVSDDV